MVDETQQEPTSERAIPSGVYYHAESGNFYDARNNEGLGITFWNTWYSRRAEFPTDRLHASQTTGAPDYKAAFDEFHDRLTWMHDNKALRSYGNFLGMRLADIANALIDRAYPGLREDKAPPGDFATWLGRYVGEQNPNIMRFSVTELEIAFNAGRVSSGDGQAVAREAFYNLIADATRWEEEYDGDADGDGREVITVEYHITTGRTQLEELCDALGVPASKHMETLQGRIDRAIDETPVALK